MIEQDYIKVTNRAALQMAKDALRMVTSGKDYAVEEALLDSAHDVVAAMLRRTYEVVVITEDAK